MHGLFAGDEPCSNVIFPDDWKQYNFRNKKFGKADRKWWQDVCKDQIHKIQGNAADEANHNIQDELDWAQIVTYMSSFGNYNELQEYINDNPLPDFHDEPNDTIDKRRLTIWI